MKSWFSVAQFYLCKKERYLFLWGVAGLLSEGRMGSPGWRRQKMSVEILWVILFLENKQAPMGSPWSSVTIIKTLERSVCECACMFLVLWYPLSLNVTKYRYVIDSAFMILVQSNIFQLCKQFLEVYKRKWPLISFCNPDSRDRLNESRRVWLEMCW